MREEACLSLMLLLALSLLFGCVQKCVMNDDCVPATCCHATECVPKAQAPDCSNMYCTLECRGGTLDCGGSCECENGTCVAHTTGQ